MKIAEERKSSVLASNAVHHRIDSATSIVALIAILGSHIADNVSWLDPVVSYSFADPCSTLHFKIPDLHSIKRSQGLEEV